MHTTTPIHTEIHVAAIDAASAADAAAAAAASAAWLQIIRNLQFQDCRDGDAGSVHMDFGGGGNAGALHMNFGDILARPAGAKLVVHNGGLSEKRF